MRLHRSAIRVATAIALLSLLCFAALAQSYRGRVQGIVTDPSRAVIINANVTLLNVATGIKATRQSSETGLYLFDMVEPGIYTVTVEATGFGKFTQENITVQMRR